MKSQSPRRLGLILCGLAVVLWAGCGGSSAGRSPDGDHETTDRAAAGRLPLLAEIPLVVMPDEPLDRAFERVRQAYIEAGHEVFDAHRAYATSSARDFAWYFTIQDPDDSGGRLHHVFFVITRAWDSGRTRQFLVSYLVMAAASADQAGRHRFHFHSAYPLPFAVRFLFSNTSLGALEASILTDLGTQRWEAQQVAEITRHLSQLLERTQLATAGQLSEQCPGILDEIFGALPRPLPDDADDVFGRRYVPEGTLAAIGLLVGESIRRTDPQRIAWEADDVSTVYPRLRISGMREGILRPCSMMVELFTALAEVTPTQYCGQMVDRAADYTGRGSQPDD